MSRSRGKRFESEIKRSMEHLPDTWAYRMPDTLIGKSTVGGRPISIRSPSDLLVLTPLVDMMIECKAVKGISIAFDRLAPHQGESLSRFNEANRRLIGLVAVNFYNGKRGRNHKNVAYLIPIHIWYHWQSRLKRKSIPESLCEDTEKVLRLEWEKQVDTLSYGWTIPPLESIHSIARGVGPRT